MAAINDLNLLNLIKEICYTNDTRASWVGPDLPETDVESYSKYAKWATEHLKMYQGFYNYLNRDLKYNVLDIACGVGYATNILAQYLSNSKFTAVELDNKCINFAKKYNDYQSIQFLEGDVLEYIEKSFYDIIFFLETLEHLKPNTHYLAIDNLLQNLKSDGLLFITTPNSNDADTGHHRGMLNSNRFLQFKERYINNIVLINYYNGPVLHIDTNTPQDCITDLPSSHYRIIMKK